MIKTPVTRIELTRRNAGALAPSQVTPTASISIEKSKYKKDWTRPSRRPLMKPKLIMVNILPTIAARPGVWV